MLLFQTRLYSKSVFENPISANFTFFQTFIAVGYWSWAIDLDKLKNQNKTLLIPPPPTHTHTHHDTRELQMWSLEQYHSSEIAFTKFGMIGSSKNFMLEHRAISIYNVQDSAIRKFDTPNSVRLPWPLDLFNYAFEWPWSLAYKLLVVIWQS